MGGAVIDVLKLALLFTGEGSVRGFPDASFALTVAVLVMAEVTFRTTVSVALLPTVMPPMLHCNCDPSRAQAPWLGVPETKVAPAGTKSFTVTCGAKFGPRLLIVIEYVALPPELILTGPVMLIAMSVAPKVRMGITALLGADSGPAPLMLVA